MANDNFSESNFEYVTARLKQHQFPNTRNAELKEQMQQGKNLILLEFHSEDYSGAVRATAQIEKSNSGVYFPNRYELELKKPEAKQSIKQFFPIQNFKGHGNQYDVPWKMGVNLLRGGQVLNNWLREDGSTVNEWRALDFSKRTLAGHGYVSFDRQQLDVVKRLDLLPIQEKDKGDLRHSHVVKSIEMGNRQAVHLEIPGNPVITLVANVRKKDLDIVRGGNYISVDQFNSELAESRDQGAVMGRGARQSGPPVRQATSQRENVTSDAKKGLEQPVSGAARQSQLKETSNTEPNKEIENLSRGKRVLSGNTSGRSRSNGNRSHIRHGQ
jgi:hypothetical protein